LSYNHHTSNWGDEWESNPPETRNASQPGLKSVRPTG